MAGMKNREERSKHFFDSGPLMEEDEELALYDKVRGCLHIFECCTIKWKHYVQVKQFS